MVWMKEVEFRGGRHALLMATEVEGCKATVADSEFFRG